MIDSNTLRAAAAYVDECGQVADIHTVTLVTSGSHGGVDLTIEGTTTVEGTHLLEDYVRRYEV